MDKKLPEKLCFNNSYLSLPSEWDSSLSQLEMMQKIAYNINQIIQFLTDLESNYQDYTDSKVAELKEELLHTLDETVKSLTAYIDTQDAYYWAEHTKDIKRVDELISELRKYVDNVVTTHHKDIAQLNGKIDETKEYLEEYADFAVERLKNWVEEQLDNLRLEIDEVNEDGFKIFDPTTGYRGRVGNTVNNVYDALRVFAITCGYFDKWFTAFDKNCADFKNLYVRAGEFDAKGKELLYGAYNRKVNSPASGTNITHARALDEVMQNSAELHLTAQEFDSVMGESCNAIKSKNKNALWWDTENATFYDNYNIGNGMGNRTVGRSAHGFIKIGIKSIEIPSKPAPPSTYPFKWNPTIIFNFKTTNDNESNYEIMVETNDNTTIVIDNPTLYYSDGLVIGFSKRFNINLKNETIFNAFSFASIRGKITSENVLLKEMLV